MKNKKQKLTKIFLIIIFLLIFIFGLMLTLPKNQFWFMSNQNAKNSILEQNNQLDNSNKNAESNTSVVEIETSKGNIQILLEKEKAPKTVAKFLELVDSKFYNDTLFDKVFDWEIQTSYKSDNKVQVTKLPIEINYSLINQKGAVGMIYDEVKKDSGLQFYILKKDAPWFDAKNTIFGHVLFGINIVESIREGDKIINMKRIR